MLIYGWPLEQVNISVTTILTQSVQILVWKRVGHFLLSMHSLDVTQHLPSAAFIYIAQHPYEPISLSSEHFLVLERYTVVLYNKSSCLTTINEARRELFCKKNKSLENIPPT